MPEPVVLRPRGSQVLAWTAIGTCGAGLILMVLTDGITSLAQWSWPIVLVAWLAWALYVFPYVSVTDGFVEIGNPFRTHRVPWGDIDRVDTRYALTLETNGGQRIRAWAAPAPGARQALTTRREEVSRTPGDSDTRRPADAEGTPSGDAGGLVRRRLEAYRRSDAAASGETVSTLNVVMVGVTAVLLGASVLSLALPHG